MDVTYGKMPPAPLDLPYAAPNMPQDEWIKALLNQAANIIEDPAIKPRIIDGIKRLIPGRAFDGFADNILEMVVKALRQF